MLVLESLGAALLILFNCEHRFAELEHEAFRTVPQSRPLFWVNLGVPFHTFPIRGPWVATQKLALGYVLCQRLAGRGECRESREVLQATRTGLEPATSGSTVRGSNQLSYRAIGSIWIANYIGRPGRRKASLRREFAEPPRSCRLYRLRRPRQISDTANVPVGVRRSAGPIRVTYGSSAGAAAAIHRGFPTAHAVAAANLSRCQSSNAAISAEFSMLNAIFANFSFSAWFFEAWSDLVRYFHTMNTLQWGIVSASAVIFGFLCLKGSGINR